MRLLIDSYAWVEYLEGSDAGQKVKRLLKEEKEIFTIALTIAEVISRASRRGTDLDIPYQAIISNSVVVEITSALSKEAGAIHAEINKKIKNFGLVDAFLLVAAKMLNAKIVTGDEHFRKFKNVIFIK